MPDWSALVRDRLNLAEFTPAQQKETIAELAGHLEELFEGYLAQGLSESEAAKRALLEVNNWHDLAKTIHRAKRKEGIMNSRAKQFWLPALVSLTGSMVLLMVLQLAGSRMQTPWKHAGVPLLPYAIWLAALPLVGAASSHLSLRAGGSLFTRIAAILFPSTVMFGLWLVILATLLARKSPQSFQTVNFFFGLMFWVVVPGTALLLGALPRSIWKKAQA